MNLLNLDDLSSPKKTVKIFGTDYAVADQSLGQLISILNESKKSKGKKQTEADVADMLIKQASQFIPDCPEEKLMKLNMRQLNALIDFARMSDEEIEQQAAESEAAMEQSKESSENVGKQGKE